MSVRLLWKPGTPDDVRAALAPVVDVWAWLVPSWCHTLTLAYDGDDAANIAKCRPRPHYRDADLWVCGPWLALPAEERVRDVIHELAHLVVAPMQTFGDNLIDQCLPADAPARKWAESEWSRAYEGVVCDLTRAVRGREP